MNLIEFFEIKKAWYEIFKKETSSSIKSFCLLLVLWPYLMGKKRKLQGGNDE